MLKDESRGDFEGEPDFCLSSLSISVVEGGGGDSDGEFEERGRIPFLIDGIENARILWIIVSMLTSS